MSGFGSEILGGSGLDLGLLGQFGSPAGGGGAASAMTVGGIDISSLPIMDQLQALSLGKGMEAQDAYIANLNSAVQPSKLTTGINNFSSIMNGVGSLANIWMGLQGMKLQKEAFKLNKSAINTNLNNGISDYNRRLEDTVRLRALNMGGGATGDAYVTDQLARFSAKRS